MYRVSYFIFRYSHLSFVNLYIHFIHYLGLRLARTNAGDFAIEMSMVRAAKRGLFDHPGYVYLQIAM